MWPAPESSALATVSVRIVSSSAPGYASRRSSSRCSRSTRVSPTVGPETFSTIRSRTVNGAAPRFVLDRSLTELAYRCHPDGCPRGRTCCVGLVVELSRREMRAIDTLMDELAELVPRLREGRGFTNVFVDDPPDLVAELPGQPTVFDAFRAEITELCGATDPPRPAAGSPSRRAARAAASRTPRRRRPFRSRRTRRRPAVG